MENKICLITGATEGVGKQTALQLARRGFTVVIAARNAEKAARVVHEIASATGNMTVAYIACDLRSLKQTRQLAGIFQERYPRLDVLINNAGIFAPRRVLTEDGFESTFQVNYLSHFLLTRLLLDDLRRSGRGRVVNLSSSVYSIGKFDLSNLQSERHFSVLGTYSASKLLMLLFTTELAKRLEGTRITANAVHPGIVRTPMMLGAPGMFKVISYLSLPFSVSPAEGATTSVHLAAAEELAGVSGRYFVQSKPVQIKTPFNTKEHRASLWERSSQSLLNAGLLTTSADL